ncbi:unnamed protein product [Adineta ricciae]|uniref:PARP n=1 Tax=Adineta ricciae TaxID=249248 RepID=A0A814XX73_ADIRI|nr:unnamed protein product [Adineta ricciae]
MGLEKLEQILTLFEQCHSGGKPLELTINEDLLKCFALPPKVILDLLQQHSIDAISYLSNDKTKLHFQNNLYLCPIDQTEADSCHSTTCRQLHLCEDYILNKSCVQFQSNGKCSHAHSLMTKHNQMVLEQYGMSSTDEQIYQFISRLIRLSLLSTKQPKFFVQSVDKQPITDELIDEWLGDHKSLLSEQKRVNSYTIEFIFEDNEVTSMIEDIIRSHHASTALVLNKITPDPLSSNRILDATPAKQKTDEDLDQKVQSTITKVFRFMQLSFKQGFFQAPSIITRRFSNQLRNLEENPAPQPFGRGRGRQTSTVPPNPPSLPSSNGEKKFIFSTRLNSKTNEQTLHSSTNQINSPTSSMRSTPESVTLNSSQPANHTDNSFPRYVLSRTEQKQKNQAKCQNHCDDSSLSSDYHSPDMMSSPDQQDTKSRPRFVIRDNSLRNKETSSISPTTPKSPSPIVYTFKKQFSDQHLCYLLGPGRKQIVDKDQCEIIRYLPSGCCRSQNIEQGKEIEKQLHSIIPPTLNIDLVKIKEDLALLIRSSAAENLFQQNQSHYAIFSEPIKIQLNIEVIETESSTTSNRSAAAETDEYSNSQISSDGIFHIRSTGSSINVVSGDISEVQVDMMICISTSNNLRESVLRRAGPTVQKQYKERYCSDDALLVDGGLTKAEKILLVPWKTEIDRENISLSELVTWSIDKAHDRNVKTVSFPPIGTGELNLDPLFVCEALIGAASERLHQYQMNVIFVVYPKSDRIEEDGCYQIFRQYLNSLCAQIPSTSNERKAKTTSEVKRRVFKRDVQSKRILTLSALQNINEHRQLLVESLEKLIDEQVFDLNLVESKLSSQVDSLIDICLSHNVFPRVDCSSKKLTLRGDRESRLQCFFNLCPGKGAHQYSYVFTEMGEKSEEKQFNSYISLKIDEAFAAGEAMMRIQDNEQSIFDIDFSKLQVRPTKTRRNAFLVKKPLDDSKIRIPPSWSSSPLKIRTKEISKSSYETLECIHIFQQTMSMSDWQIDRIEAIENYPLYLHYMHKKSERTNIYFHGCSFASVQSIVHYGLHSTNASHYGDNLGNCSTRSICLTRDALNSHLYGTRRCTDGKHYLFVVEFIKYDNDNSFLYLSNEDACSALPTYLIVYQRRQSGLK